MSDFRFYLELKPFVRQYLVRKFGDPLCFEPGSVTNAKIIAVLTVRRGEEQPDVAKEGMTAVSIPYSKQKDPRYYNHITPEGKKFIVQHLESIFLSNLWTEMHEMCCDGEQLQQAANAWCEKHGISLDYSDTIRMKYYREKKKLLRKDIDLRNKRRITKK